MTFQFMAVNAMEKSFPQPRWQSAEGGLISCTEKLKVLRENLEEIQQVCQDAFEDALLMGCDEAQIRAVFAQVVAELRNPYEKN